MEKPIPLVAIATEKELCISSVLRSQIDIAVPHSSTEPTQSVIRRT